MFLIQTVLIKIPDSTLKNTSSFHTPQPYSAVYMAECLWHGR